VLTYLRNAVEVATSVAIILFLLAVCWGGIGVLIGITIKAAQFVIGL
jgi:hypothetical protein